MTSRSRLRFPNRADGTLLPGALVALLALAFALQAGLADREPELPSVLAVGMIRGDFGMPAVAPVSADQAIFDRPLFAPRQSLVAGSGSAPLPLGGASVAGTITIRGRAFAVVRRANGTISNVAIGGAVDGWRLIALRPEGAVFEKSNVRREVVYGAGPIANADNDTTQE